MSLIGSVYNPNGFLICSHEARSDCVALLPIQIKDNIWKWRRETTLLKNDLSLSSIATYTDFDLSILFTFSIMTYNPGRN